MAHPTTLLGRYRVVRELGRGSTATVYEVLDELTGSEVPIAAKVITPEPTGIALERLRSEFRILTTVRHPHIVQAHDLHILPGIQPAILTLEYVRGLSFLDAAKQLPLAKSIRLLQQVCLALQRIHSAGYAHRDIKSENLLVELHGEAARTVVMDFSFAGRDGLMLSGEACGTPHYLPPEVVEGQPADKRGDLYSLGVLAYRLFAGVFPFRGSDTAGLFRAITSSSHQPLHELAPHLSPELSSLVERLLSRDPERRVQSANALHLALERHANSEHTWAQLAIPSSDDWPLVGRPRELALLHKHIDRLNPNHGKRARATPHVVLLEGEAGIGKSRLLREVKHYAQLGSISYVPATCLGRRQAPLHSISEILRTVISMAKAYERQAPRCLELFRSHKQLISRLVDHDLIDTTNATTWIEERSTWIQDQVVRFLTECSQLFPFIIAIEDIHKADPSTQDCLQAIAKHAEEARYLCIYTSRSEGSAELTAGIPANRLSRVSLSPLSVADQETLVRMLTGIDEDTEPIARSLDRLTGGRPLFVDLVLHQLVQKENVDRAGAQIRIDSSVLDSMPVLESVNTWATEWLSQFDHHEMVLLQALAVLNRPVDPSTLFQIATRASGYENIGPDMLSRLLGRRLLTQAGQSVTGLVSFSHALFRETVYNGLASDVRVRLHSMAADSLLSLGSQTDTHRPAELAMHLREAGRNEEAAQFALQAARLAFKTFALDEAEKFYQLALDFLDPDDVDSHLEALEGLAEVFILAHRYEEAGGLLRALTRRATESRRPSFLARGLAGLAEVHLGASQYLEAEQLSERALKIAKEIQDPRTEARALRAYSDTRHYQSRLDEAKSAYSELVSLWEKIGDELGSASAWHNLGWVCNSLRNFEEAATYFLRAEAIYRKAGNIPRLANTLSALGANELDAGHFHSAVSRLEDALKQAGRSRGRRTEALCHANLGQARHRLGQFPQALANLEAARQTLLVLKNSRYLAPVDMTIGWILTEQGDYGRAEKYLASAREAYLSLEDQPGLAMCLAAQANINRLLGDATSSRFWCERSLEIARAANDSQVIAVCLTSMSLALAEEGETLQAIEALVEARSLAREVGAGDTEHLASLSLARIMIFTDRLDEMAGLLQRLFERAEKMHLAADIPAIQFLQSLFRVRFGEISSARRILDDAIQRADVTSSAETRWELRQLRLLVASPSESAHVEKLEREVKAWIQSCASTIPEDDRRRAFLRRCENRNAQLKEILGLPALTPGALSIDDTSRPDNPLPTSSEELAPSVHPATDTPSTLAALCRSADEETRLRSVLHLLVDRVVHGTQSDRGGLFLATDTGILEAVALRNLARDSLHDARLLSASVLRLAAETTEPVVLGDGGSDSRWMEVLTVRARAIPAICAVPIPDVGVLYLDRTEPGRPYGDSELRIAESLAAQLARVLASIKSQGDTWARLDDLELAVRQFDRQVLPGEDLVSSQGITATFGSVTMVGRGPSMRAVFDQTRKLAASRTPVLIVGETGTGKELVARALHEASPWKEEPFVALDCGALTENLAEAELFGHARGAFSGADREREGLLRSAGKGTLFLDEIGNLSLPLQLKLLRALETAEVRPVGADRVESVHFRLVAATNIRLTREIAKGRFREDLYHRLQGGLILLPPLREHMEDLETLTRHFLQQIAEQLGRPAPEISPAAWNVLHAHSWPGNARELRMALQVAMAMSDRPVIETADLPERITDSAPASQLAHQKRHASPSSGGVQSLGDIRIPDEMEGRMILRVLTENSWDKAASARKIGWSRQKLYRAMKLYRIPLRVSDGQLQTLHDHLAALSISLDSRPPSQSTH